MIKTFSRSLIIWEPAIETWAQQMNWGLSNELRARRAEQFRHLGNDTLTPASRMLHFVVVDSGVTARGHVPTTSMRSGRGNHG